MKFSDAGDMFAYYDIDNQTVRIVNIKEGEKDNGITELINKIRQQRFYANYVGDEKDPDNDISFIKSIEFDINKEAVEKAMYDKVPYHEVKDVKT